MSSRPLRAVSKKAAVQLPQNVRYQFLAEAARTCAAVSLELAEWLGRSALEVADDTSAAVGRKDLNRLCGRCGVPIASNTCTKVDVQPLTTCTNVSRTTQPQQQRLTGGVVVLKVCHVCGHTNRQITSAAGAQQVVAELQQPPTVYQQPLQKPIQPCTQPQQPQPPQSPQIHSQSPPQHQSVVVLTSPTQHQSVVVLTSPTHQLTPPAAITIAAAAPKSLALDQPQPELEPELRHDAIEPPPQPPQPPSAQESQMQPKQGQVAHTAVTISVVEGHDHPDVGQCDGARDITPDVVMVMDQDGEEDGGRDGGKETEDAGVDGQDRPRMAKTPAEVVTAAEMALIEREEEGREEEGREEEEEKVEEAVDQGVDGQGDEQVVQGEVLRTGESDGVGQAEGDGVGQEEGDGVGLEEGDAQVQGVVVGDVLDGQAHAAMREGSVEGQTHVAEAVVVPREQEEQVEEEASVDMAPAGADQEDDSHDSDSVAEQAPATPTQISISANPSRIATEAVSVGSAGKRNRPTAPVSVHEPVTATAAKRVKAVPVDAAGAAAGVARPTAALLSSSAVATLQSGVGRGVAHPARVVASLRVPEVEQGGALPPGRDGAQGDEGEQDGWRRKKGKKQKQQVVGKVDKQMAAVGARRLQQQDGDEPLQQEVEEEAEMEVEPVKQTKKQKKRSRECDEVGLSGSARPSQTTTAVSSTGGRAGGGSGTGGVQSGDVGTSGGGERSVVGPVGGGGDDEDVVFLGDLYAVGMHELRRGFKPGPFLYRHHPWFVRKRLRGNAVLLAEYKRIFRGRDSQDTDRT